MLPKTWRTARHVMFCKAKAIEVWSAGKRFGPVLRVSTESRQGQIGEEKEEEEIFCTAGLQQIPLTKGSTKFGN